MANPPLKERERIGSADGWLDNAPGITAAYGNRMPEGTVVRSKPYFFLCVAPEGRATEMPYTDPDLLRDTVKVYVETAFSKTRILSEEPCWPRTGRQNPRRYGWFWQRHQPAWGRAGPMRKPPKQSPPVTPRASLSATLDKVKDLIDWPEGWNGYDVAAPNPDAIKYALTWIRGMHADATATEWHNPHVAADEDGDVLFEWWNGDKALTIYISEDEVRYVKGWGLDMEAEMEDGLATTPEIRGALWEWLMD